MNPDKMKKKVTQKDRLDEAYDIHSRFHVWLGYIICDGEEDLLSLRKLYKKIQREIQKQERERFREIIEKIDFDNSYTEDEIERIKDVLFELKQKLEEK